MTHQQLIELRKQVVTMAVEAVAASTTAADLNPLVCLVSVCDGTGLSTRILCSVGFKSEEALNLEVSVNAAMQDFVGRLPDIVAARASGELGDLHDEKGLI